MLFTLYLPLLVLLTNLSRSMGNPHQLPIRGNIAKFLNQIKEANYQDPHTNGNLHSLKEFNPNLWRRSGNPGKTRKSFVYLWLSIVPKKFYLNGIFEMFLKLFVVFIDFEDSCSMATADKCTGAIPPGAYDAFNDTSLLEVT